jgi:hypothetical protein
MPEGGHFFDADYIRLRERMVQQEDRAEREVGEPWSLLGPKAGARSRDAPCGCGAAVGRTLGMSLACHPGA